MPLASETHQPIEQAIDRLTHHIPTPKHYHIFVYGTLRKGCYNHVRFGMEIEGKFVKEDYVHGYKLLHCQYPFMIPTGNEEDVVVGEIYHVEEYFKNQLDLIEQGYKLTEVKPNIHAYVIRSIANAAHEVPVDASGFYNWSPKVEAELNKKYYPDFYKTVEALQHEQKSKRT